MRKKSWRREFAGLVEDSFDYLCAQKRYIYAVALIFLASAIVGFVFASSLSFFDNILKDVAEKTSGLDYLELIWFIFSNNITSSLTALFLGVFFGVFPLFNALFNGSLLGYVYSKVVPIEGYLVIWRLFPHGLLELPAVFISLGLGVHLGASLFGSNRRETFVVRWKESMKVFLVIVFPLLALAAIIESTLIVFAG